MAATATTTEAETVTPTTKAPAPPPKERGELPRWFVKKLQDWGDWRRAGTHQPGWPSTSIEYRMKLYGCAVSGGARGNPTQHAWERMDRETRRLDPVDRVVFSLPWSLFIVVYCRYVHKQEQRETAEFLSLQQPAVAKRLRTAHERILDRVA